MRNVRAIIFMRECIEQIWWCLRRMWAAASGTPDAWKLPNPERNMSAMPFPRTGARFRFTPADWQFIIETLGESQSSRRSLASLCDDPDSVSQILDHPKLFEAVVMTRRTAMMSPSLFFFVVVRHTLREAGVPDLEVADYMAVVCADYGLPKGSQISTDKPDVSSLYNVDYLEALDRASGAERFFIHVRCANQFLVLTCLYPSFLHQRAERRGAPGVEYYEQVVISHLAAAGHHALAEEFDLDDVLLRLAEKFPPVRRAMNYALREYLCLGS